MIRKDIFLNPQSMAASSSTSTELRKIDYIIGSEESGSAAIMIREWISSEKARELYYHYSKSKKFGPYTWQNPRTKQVRVLDHRTIHTSGNYYSPLDPHTSLYDQETVALTNKIHQDFGLYCPGAFLNYYASGNNYIPYHSDGDSTPVFGLALGPDSKSTRRFYFRPKNNKRAVIKSYMEPGDLFVMYGNVDKMYQHSVPKQAGVGPRISVTFRGGQEVDMRGPYIEGVKTQSKVLVPVSVTQLLNQNDDQLVQELTEILSQL